jgi:hypothetical protein
VANAPVAPRAASVDREIGTILLLAGSVATAVGLYEVGTSEDPMDYWIDLPVPGGVGVLALVVGFVLVRRARAKEGRMALRAIDGSIR